MLKSGTIVLYAGAPHRVEYVNTCRAYLVPLRRPRKRRRPPKGVSIGVDSLLPTLTDAEAEAALTTEAPSDTSSTPVRRLTLPGWVATDAPPFRPGSVNERVLNYIILHPRQRTPAIVAALKQDEPRNIVACIRRLYVAGVITKE